MAARADNAIAPSSYSPRTSRWSPLRQEDGGAFNRTDVQYDLLHEIFTDPTRAFTDPTPIPQEIDPINGAAPKCTFAELYVNTLLNSPKCSRPTREKMLQEPDFAVDFAKLCLLVNVGRVNTTITFDYEATTQFRHYVCVPSLMCSHTSRENMLDVPRMRSLLRASLLPTELNRPVSTPTECLHRLASGVCPPTAIPNLIFMLATHSSNVSRLHFEGTFEFLDIFTDALTRSKDRSRAFLWTIFRYLEGEYAQNPWDDQWSRKTAGKAPLIPTQHPTIIASQNVDTHEELDIAQYCKHKRKNALKTAAVRKAPEQQVGGSRGTVEAHHLTAEDIAQTLRRIDRKGPNGHQPQWQGMLAHAWKTSRVVDPLDDSDDELPPSIVKVDYSQRVSTLSDMLSRSAWRQ